MIRSYLYRGRHRARTNTLGHVRGLLLLANVALSGFVYPSRPAHLR